MYLDGNLKNQQGAPSHDHPSFHLDGDSIGFIQYYFADETTIGLDMWLGTPQVRGKGYGSDALRQMVQLIHRKHPAVRELFIDLDAENHRAIRCYCKAGFQDAGEITDEEGNHCLLLKIRFDHPNG